MTIFSENDEIEQFEIFWAHKIPVKVDRKSQYETKIENIQCNYYD